MTKPLPSVPCRIEIITAPATVTRMANQSNTLRLSPRNSTAMGATKIGNVWVTGTARETSRLATTRKKITPPNPPNRPAASPQPADVTVRPSRGETTMKKTPIGM